jgi:hypothetical protein
VLTLRLVRRRSPAAGASACSGSLCSPGSYGPAGKPGPPRDPDVTTRRAARCEWGPCARSARTCEARWDSDGGECGAGAARVCAGRSWMAGQGRRGRRTATRADLISGQTVRPPPWGRDDAVVGRALLAVPGRILRHRHRRAPQRFDQSLLHSSVGASPTHEAWRRTTGSVRL